MQFGISRVYVQKCILLLTLCNKRSQADAEAIHERPACIEKVEYFRAVHT